MKEKDQKGLMHPNPSCVFTWLHLPWKIIAIVFFVFNKNVSFSNSICSVYDFGFQISF